MIAGHLTSGAKDSDEALRLTDLTGILNSGRSMAAVWLYYGYTMAILWLYFGYTLAILWLHYC